MMTRVVFMGSCPFARIILERLAKDFSICGVFTAPPKPKGRGYVLQNTCVHDYAQSMGWPVFTPSTFKDERAVLDLKSLSPSVAVVASYGLLLPQRVLDIPTAGCVNVHPSILPRWRGASPLVYPILMGDQQTGVAIMVMDAGMDTGPVLIQKSMPIAPDTTTELLGHQLAEMGAAALCDVLPDYLLGHLKPTPQGLEGVTLAPKISKDMGLLDCRNDAHQLVRKVNALHPWPGTWLLIAGEKVTILKASAVDIPENPFTSGVLVDDASGDPKADLWHTPGHTQGTPGQAFKVASQHTAHAHPQISQAPHGIQDVLPGHIIPWAQDWAVVCGQNTLLCPSVLRAPNGKIMDAGAFMRGYRALLGL